ncbi:MAG: hypothetical protein GY778_25525 [bacterium]|nr:hypothetical protein [bacterium]
MMQSDPLIKAARDGNLNDVEELWMARLTSESMTPEAVHDLLPVLDLLGDRGRLDDAATLAWTTLDTLKEKFDGDRVLPIAGPLLLKFGDHVELRTLVTELYRAVYADHPALERLVEESGIAGGRPARRALRIMDVCLWAEPGKYLASRDHGPSVTVVDIDHESCRYQVRSPDKSIELGPVELSDRYAPADDDDFAVMQDFFPERLNELLAKDPAGVVISILRNRGRTLDSEALQEMLCPAFIETGQWKKSWTKTRTALKRDPHVEIEGRSPHYLTYRPQARTLEQETREHFAKLADPADQLATVDKYLRECRTRKHDPDAELLTALSDLLEDRAGRQEARGASLALATRLVQRRVEQEVGRTRGDEAAVRLLGTAKQPLDPIRGLDPPALWPGACDCLIKAWPDRRLEFLSDLLPIAPLSACDHLASALVEAGYTAEQFDGLTQRVLSDAVTCVGALLWIWDGPKQNEVRSPRLVGVLTRILNVLAAIRRDDQMPRERVRRISTDVRSALAARKYKRFNECLDQIEPGVGGALRTQIRRLDNLGRAVHEDLLKLLAAKFPITDTAPAIAPWADEEVLWVTAAGLGRKQAEITELVNVTMKENAKRIGEAASLGDLSENSEYKFALEERDLLRARLAQMQGQVAQSQVLDKQEVPTNHIGVGSRAICRHLETGAMVDLTFLGPWEADVEQHMYNYKAPLAQALMGLEVGEQVELIRADPPGQYTIEKIENALA